MLNQMFFFKIFLIIFCFQEYLDVVQVPLPACFLDPPPSTGSQPDLDLTSPDSVDSTSLRDCEVASQSSQVQANE